MSLEAFVGEELLHAVAALTARSLVGPWADVMRARRAAHFRAAWYAESHAHPHVELCLLLGGRCAMSYNFKHYRMKAGDLGFFPPNLPHAETYLKANQPYRLAWWTLTRERLVVHVTGYTQRQRWRMTERIELAPLTQETRAATVQLERFVKSAKAPPVLALKEALLTLTVAMIRQLQAGGSQEQASARRGVIAQAQAFIAEAGGRTLSIGEVAREVLLSPNYLTTLFRAETGVPLGTYIKRERMKEAKSLLSGTTKSIKAIAGQLGFDDPYVFSRTFKRVEGISPQGFRERT